MKKLLLYSVYIFSPVIIIATSFINNVDKYSQTYYLLTLISGSTAYTWFMWQFILSAKLNLFTKIIGVKKLYMLHGIMALVSIYFGILHGYSLAYYYSFSLLTFIGITTIVIYSFISVVSLMFKPYMKKIHYLSIAGLIMMQVHVLLTSGASLYYSLFSVYNIYFIITLSVYSYYKILRPWINQEQSTSSKKIIKTQININDNKTNKMEVIK